MAVSTLHAPSTACGPPRAGHGIHVVTRAQLKALEEDLGKAADNLRANSDLKASEYSTPVLGLIFLRFADNLYSQHEEAILEEYESKRGTRLEKALHEVAIEKCGLYLPDHARYDYLLNLPEEEDAAKAIKEAMVAIEEYKTELEGVLPTDEYFRLTRTDRTLPNELLKVFSDIPPDAGGDVLGQIYEYFLGRFALAEGQGGGTFFTPRSVVQLMVAILEPQRGKVFDPACGSGGMFVQSAHFIEEHRREREAGGSGTDEIYVYGQEKTLENVKLAKMNLAVNGLRGDIRQANTYYNDPFKSVGKFDYVMANPPFNVDDVSLEAVEDEERFNTYGVPRRKTKKKSEKGKETVPNANYLWINLFATSLKPTGRASLVMANSASDARHSEAEIRKTLIEENLIYGMLTLPSNMFYTVTLPATLWFFDRDKPDDRILFIDARNIYTPIDRAHREFSAEQVQNIALISYLRRGQREPFVETVDGYFAEGMKRLKDSKAHVGPLAERLAEVLNDEDGTAAVAELEKPWAELDGLKGRYDTYRDTYADADSVEAKNVAQHELREAFDPFFEALHAGLKHLGKSVRQHEKARAEAARAKGKRFTTDQETKRLKQALEAMREEVKSAELYHRHIHWLQDRFPEAAYEDVTGLCKLATLVDVRDEGYSLNAGRYVGVVVEDDGMTEEEFISEILDASSELEMLGDEANRLTGVIAANAAVLAGEE